MKIYVLKLENNKYYVGRTTNSLNRILDHVEEHGSEWTKKYEPVDIDKVFDGVALDEDKTVLEYMNKYGVDNVRGGSFSTIHLSENEVKALTAI